MTVWVRTVQVRTTDCPGKDYGLSGCVLRGEADMFKVRNDVSVVSIQFNRPREVNQRVIVIAMILHGVFKPHVKPLLLFNS